MQIIRQQGCAREGEPQNIQPQGRVDIRQIAAEAHLQQKSCQADRSNHYQGERAQEGITPREDHNQREREDQQSGSDYRPSTSNSRARIRQWAPSTPFCIGLLYPSYSSSQ